MVSLTPLWIQMQLSVRRPAFLSDESSSQRNASAVHGRNVSSRVGEE